MAYIDRDAALNYQNEVEPCLCRNAHTGEVFSATRDDALVKYLEQIPAADVRPVVTCAECKHNNACLTQAFVEEASRVPFDRTTFFCADGKRADDA